MSLRFRGGVPLVLSEYGKGYGLILEGSEFTRLCKDLQGDIEAAAAYVGQYRTLHTSNTKMW